MKPTPEARLAQLMWRAQEVERLEVSTLLPDGSPLGCVYQRPRYYRSKRVEEGFIESLCFVFYALEDGRKVSFFKDQALRLLQGLPRQAETGEDVFAGIARNHDLRPLP